MNKTRGSTWSFASTSSKGARAWCLAKVAHCFFAVSALPQVAVAQTADLDADEGDKPENLAQRVLDARGMSEMSLERLLDLPVVTASGKAEERSLAAANVTIVTRDTIERRGYRSLAEILRAVPGLYVSYDYVNYSVGVREVTGGIGGGTRIVKIMIDGYPVGFRPDLQAFLGPEFIPVEAIARVEVAKGPLSALYGANAFIATVNVITREPEENAVEVAQRYHVMQGNPGMGTSAFASIAGVNRSLLLSANFESLDRSSVQAVPTYKYQTLENPALRQPSADDWAKPFGLFGRFDYHHDKYGDLRLQAGYQELDSKAEFLLNSLVTHRSRVNIVNRWTVLNWSKHARSLTTRAYVGVSDGAPQRDYALFLTGNVNQSYRPRFDYRSVNLLAEVSYDFGRWLQSDVGVDSEIRREGVLYYTQTYYRDTNHRPFEEVDILPNDVDRHNHYRQVGAYLQLRTAPIGDLPDLRLTSAGRIDWIEFGSVHYAPQASFRGAIAYRFDPRFTARVIAGRAFQTPSGTLLFANAGFGNERNVLGSELLQNPVPLRPQVVTSAELVISAQLSRYLTVEGSLYYQDLDDAIRFTQTAQLIVAKNGGEQKTVGGEILANLQFGRVRPYVAVSASRQLSATVTRDLRGIASFSGSSSLYPRLFGHAGVDLELISAMLFANVELRWAGQRGASQLHFYQNDTTIYSLGSYKTVDATISTGGLPLFDRARKTRVLLSSRNLTGEKYIEPGFSGVDIPQPGTTFMFQVRQEL